MPIHNLAMPTPTKIMNKFNFLSPCRKLGLALIILIGSAGAGFGAINFPEVTPPEYDAIDLGEVSVIDMDDYGDVLISPDFGETQIWSGGETYDLPNEGTWGWQMLTPNGTALGFYDNEEDYGFVSSTKDGEPDYVSFYDIAGNYVSGNITAVTAAPNYSYATREGLYVPLIVSTHTHLLNDADSNDVGYDNEYWMMVRLNPNGTVSKMGDAIFYGGDLSPTGNYTISYDIATDAAGDRLTRNYTGPYTSYEDAVYYTSGYELDEWSNPVPIISEIDYTHTVADGLGTGNLTLTSGDAPTDHKVITNPYDDAGYAGYGVPYNIFEGSGYRLGNKNVLAHLDGKPVLVNPYFNYTGPTFLTIENSTLTSANLTSGNSTVDLTSLNTEGLGLTWLDNGTLWLNNTTLTTANVTQISGVNMFALREADGHAYLLIPRASFGLAVDFNRDGNITFDGDDDTSPENPFVFWVNNDADRTTTLDSYTIQDDLNPADFSGNLDWNQNTIASQRDLEDFARLWVKTGAHLSDIKSGNICVGLKWVDYSGNIGNSTTPAIKLFSAVQSSGNYLTNSTIAASQITGNYANATVNVDTSENATLVQPTTNDWDFILPTALFANISANNTFVPMLFEGCRRGTGTLTMVLLHNNGGGNFTELTDTPTTTSINDVSLDLRDVKELYERWTVGDGPTPGWLSTLLGSGEGGGGAPAGNATISTDRLPAGVSGLCYATDGPGLSVTGDDNENAYILLVHGWNMQPWLKDAWAETAFKRLYWQGYKGKFGTFQWPTTYHDWNIAAITDYDIGEYSAWLSAGPLADLLADSDRLGWYANHSGGVYLLGHSMGNIVSGEALRLGAVNVGPLAASYVASQAAVPAHAYDPSISTPGTFWDPRDVADVPILTPLGIFSVSSSVQTANIYPDWFTPIVSANLGNTSVINFFNENDYALTPSHWEADQILKPDTYTSPSQAGFSSTGHAPYHFSGNTNATLAQVSTSGNFFSNTINTTTNHTLTPVNSSINDHYEIMAFAAQPRTRALGVLSGVGNMTAQQSLPGVWPTDSYNTSGNSSLDYTSHPWHDAQFISDAANQDGYWNKLLEEYGLPRNH